MKWWHGFFIASVLLLAGCGDSVTATNDAAATTAEEQEPTTTTTELVATTSEPSAEPAEEAAGVDPQPGDTVEVTLTDLSRCRNGGSLEAFGLVFGLVAREDEPGRAMHPEAWRGLDSIDGTFEFGSLEQSTFTAGEESIIVGYNVDVEAICVTW